MVDSLVFDLCRCHVAQRTHALIHAREARSAASLAEKRLRNSKVEKLHELRLSVELREKDIRGLEIAMHDACGVRSLQSAADLTQDLQRTADLERSPALRGKWSAREKLEDEIRE